MPSIQSDREESSQLDTFKRAAKELEAHESEARWDEQLASMTPKPEQPE